MSQYDLSDYEILRLENIRKNEAFLAGLGLQLLPTKHNDFVAISKPVKVAHSKRKKESSTERKLRHTEIPTRKSSRLQNIPAGPSKENTLSDSEESLAEGESIYDFMPMDSEQLDDFEFQVFVALRKWRLLRSRELDIEPYKVFQNRTLCELIRHRRNDPLWATSRSSFVKNEDQNDVKSVQNEARTIDNKNTSNSEVSLKETEIFDMESIQKDLLECFGIGLSKANIPKEDSDYTHRGFAWEALDIINQPDMMALLQKSRESVGVKKDTSVM